MQMQPATTNKVISNESLLPAAPTERPSIGMLSYLLLCTATLLPRCSASSLFHRVKLIAIWLWNFNTLRAWHAAGENKFLPRDSGPHPLAIGVALWPYLHAGWNFKRRTEAILNHYRQLPSVAPELAVPIHGNLLLAKLDNVRPGLNIAIDRAQWFVREGELVINIFLETKRLFSIAFALGKDKSEDVILIGGIQGVREDDISEIYKNLTKELHGIRPRDMILIALKMVCISIGIERILAISDDNRQHRHSYFKNAKVENLILNYNEIWREHGGVLNESGFYEFPSRIDHRPDESIPSRKRAMYRRRYAFLTMLQIDINKSLCKFQN